MSSRLTDSDAVIDSFRRVLWRLWASERRNWLLAYLVPALLSIVAVQTWFEPGTVIAGGDLAPPIAPQADYDSHWSHLTVGEGAPGYNISGLPYAAWLDAWGWLGVGEELGQRFWLSALFAGSAVAVVFLAFGFTANPVAAGAAGLLASFNAYRLITGPDDIRMAAILVAALLGGLVVRAASRPQGRAGVVAFAVASLGLGYVMTNPPHVALVAVWVAACLVIALVAHPDAARRTTSFLAKAVPLALLVNAWWIVPAWLTLTGPGFDERFEAVRAEEWTWTHARATLGNALTLNTTWGWEYPEYFPYADRFDGALLTILAFAFPVLALLGVVLAWRTQRRTAAGLAVAALIGAWLATGLRAPIPEVNRWLYDYMPGYWLFREPSKLLLLVMLPMAVLAGLGVAHLLTREDVWLRRLAVGLVLGALVYAHPIFTGEVIPDERPRLPSAHVRVPDAWDKAASMLNAQRASGRLLVLPRSDYYQVPTTWGYYGVAFTRPLVHRPVVESQPGGYFRPLPTVSSLEESIETDLLSGRLARARQALRALGVGYVLLRRDVDRSFPNRRFARPRLLARGLTRIPDVQLMRSFGMLDVYRVNAGEMFAATPTLYAGPEHALPLALLVQPGTPGFVSEQDDQTEVLESGLRPERLIRFEEDRIRQLAVKREPESLRVRLADPFRLTVGGRTIRGLRPEVISLPITRETPALITAASALIPLGGAQNGWQDLGLHGLQAGEAVTVWQRTEAQSIDPSTAGPVQDCNALDDRGADEVGLRAAVVTRSGRRTLRLSARAHSACVSFRLLDAPSRDLFRVRFRYRHVRGAPPRACIWQSGVNRCATVSALRPSRAWQTFEAALRPHPDAKGLTLFLYADGDGRPPPTVTEYDAIVVERYRRAAAVPGATARVRPLRGRPGRVSTLAYSPPPLPSPIDLDAAGPAGDCHRYDERPAEQLGLAARVIRQSDTRVLQLAARDHSACVNFAISEEPPARTWRIRLEYRRLSGNAPRVCLWQDGPDRCAETSSLERDGDWRVLDDTVALDPEVEAVRLFLYADGGADRTTVSEYRNVHVGPIASVALVGVPKKQPLPAIVAERDESWKVHVRVENARAPFLLATSESFAPGWEARAEGRDASDLRHVEVNGYANGWLVPWEGSYELTLEYRPERYARAARWLSLLALMAAFAWLALQSFPRESFPRWSRR
jgi:arabinofuranan 3-O-arabinosyltransferase